MVSDDLALIVGDQPRPPLRAGDHLFDRLLDVAHVDRAAVAPRRQDRTLVDEIFQVRAGEARGLLGDRIEVHVRSQRFAPGVDREDRAPPVHVRPIDDHAPIEASRPEKRRVEDIRPIGGRDHDHVGVRVEAVHLDQDLVERLLPLVVASAEPGAAMSSDGVDLVDEDDARAVLLGLFEQIPHTAGADADEHLNEFRAGDGEERNARFAGDRARHQRLAASGRADHQNAGGNPSAERDELLRLAQEFDDLGQLLLGLFDTRDIVERDRRRVSGEETSAAPTELQGLIRTALGLSEEEKEQRAEEQKRGEQDQDVEHIVPHPSFRYVEVDRVKGNIGHAELDQRRPERLSTLFTSHHRRTR